MCFSKRINMKNILFVYMLFIIKFFFLFIIASGDVREKNPVLADVNLAITFSDVMKNPFNKFKLI